MSLFIGNISESIPNDYLQDVLSKFGEMKIWNFVRLTQGKFAFIEYSEENSARNALISLNGRRLGGNILQIEYSDFPKKPLNELVGRPIQPLVTNGHAANSPHTILPDLHQSPQASSETNHEPLNKDPVLPTETLQTNEKIINDMLNPDKIYTLITKASDPEIILDLTLQNNDGNSEEIKRVKKEKDRRKKNKSKANKKISKQSICLDAGENVLEAYGNFFKIKKINKHKDENSIVVCELCQREFKKKSIRSHTASLMHKSKIS